MIPLVRVLALAAAAAPLGLVQIKGGEAPLGGRVETRIREGGSAATAVIYAEPLDGVAPSRPTSFTVEQRNKAFVPRVLGAPVGATVTFPNEDSIFHNVFSLSPHSRSISASIAPAPRKSGPSPQPAYHLVSATSTRRWSRSSSLSRRRGSPRPRPTAPGGSMSRPAATASRRSPSARAGIGRGCAGAPASQAIALTLDESRRSSRRRT